VKNGSLLNFEGLNKAYVIRLQIGFLGDARRKRQTDNDLTLLIELQDVREASDFTPSSTSSGSNDDDVRTIIWLIPVCSALELLVVGICSVIVVVWYVSLRLILIFARWAISKGMVCLLCFCVTGVSCYE
jgi:hypothetical protein